MSGPINMLAFQPSTATAYAYEGTSAVASGTTARAIPDTSCAQVMVTNRDGTIWQYVAFGASSGPNAATTTTRLPMPPNSIQVFSLPPGATHAYFEAASGTPAYSMVSGNGY
jgi:hypothetical protein